MGFEMRRSARQFLAVSIVLVHMQATQAQEPAESAYVCPAGDITYLFTAPSDGPLELEVAIAETVDPAMAGKFSLEQAERRGILTLYTNGDYSVIARGSSYSVQEGDYDPFPCQLQLAQPVADPLPSEDDTNPLAALQAQSWGGNVRSGPGTDFSILTSLVQGTPITLIENTGVDYNGYPWFEIAHPNGTGFHWGGIICGTGESIPGTFETCN